MPEKPVTLDSAQWRMIIELLKQYGDKIAALIEDEGIEAEDATKMRAIVAEVYVANTIAEIKEQRA